MSGQLPLRALLITTETAGTNLQILVSTRAGMVLAQHLCSLVLKHPEGGKESGNRTIPLESAEHQERGRTMKKFFVGQFFVLLLLCAYGFSQPETPKFNFNIGGGFGVPAAQFSNIVGTGGTFQVGGGMNLGPALGADVEYMFQNLPPKSSIIALTGAPDGSSHSNSITFNFLVHSPEAHKAGFYAIAGGGWYHRSWQLTTPSLSIGSVCLPSYLFWGVVCTNGLVSSTAVLASGSSNGGGWNAGLGLTYRLGESHYKLFTEARYHAAYQRLVTTRVIPIVFGIRF
jgi:Outer membrane protein beta-barrel domain